MAVTIEATRAVRWLGVKSPPESTRRLPRGVGFPDAAASIGVARVQGGVNIWAALRVPARAAVSN